MTHICVNKLTTIDSDNGLSYGRRQAIVWTNDGISTIGPLETNFSENLIGIQTISFNKMRLKMSSAKWRPFCLGLNVLIKHLTKAKRNKTDNNKTKQNKTNETTKVYTYFMRYIVCQKVMDFRPISPISWEIKRRPRFQKCN